MTNYLVKCSRCRNKHLESERVKKLSNKYGCWGHDLVCPRCECKTYYRLEEIQQQQKDSQNV
ncbi:hypothetical protein C3F34_10385 [Acinetobacter sp. ACNIH2]|uniref:hypothetical protein n=1 Tax=Acinetobacter sp. ACNIH2 TaxID=1758189 RepID=UPI000CDC85F1|nr:hypothetical protein [Acinetobacter sp. ACNIH2]AUX86415.1 hypothetical protein C3F34_10385 [Acinetobacter sp. ACNIH2]